MTSEPKRTCKGPIDPEDLIMALEDSDYSITYYLDLDNGKVFWIMEDSDGEEDLDGYSEQSVEDNPDRFVGINPIDSSKAFRIMEDFTSTVDENDGKELERALSGRKPFRSFKDALYDMPDVRERWFAFHHERMKGIAREWLEDEGIKAEFKTGT